MKAAYIVVGEDWTFGKGGRGNAQTLRSNCDKLGFEPVILKKRHMMAEKSAAAGFAKKLRQDIWKRLTFFWITRTA